MKIKLLTPLSSIAIHNIINGLFRRNLDYLEIMAKCQSRRIQAGPDFICYQMNAPTKAISSAKVEKLKIAESESLSIFKVGECPVYSPYELYEGQKQFASYCLRSGQNGVIQSPTGTGKTISLLCSTLSLIRHEQELGRAPTRVIYTSRTHAQLKQVVSELAKTRFDLKLAIMGSRDQGCINEDLGQLSGSSRELQCRMRTMRKNGLFCRYFHVPVGLIREHEEYYAKMGNLGQIADLEEVKAQGKAMGYCPFFYEKHCKNKANLILMPYNYLIDQDSASSGEIAALVENSIVIFDEAHNITSACESSKQFSINLSTLGRAFQQLGDLREQKLAQHHSHHTASSEQPQENTPVMKSSVADLSMQACFLSCIHAHLQTLSIPAEEPGLVMGVAQFLACLNQATQASQFGPIKDKIDALILSTANIRADILLKPFWQLETWLHFLSRVKEMFKVSQNNNNSFIKSQIMYSGSDTILNFICLDPKVGFSRVTGLKPRCLIFTSGTLSPLNSLSMQLGIQTNKPLACPHIMSREQVNGCILTHGPNKVKFNFSYDNRNDPSLYLELGLTLLQIVNRTPNGVIVFVPSYFMLEKINKQLTTNGIMSKLYLSKNVYFEKQNSASFKTVLLQYTNEACKPKGAILFALARGKVSEGLDFADGKCRALVLVGVPYPASKDLKVSSKMQYLDSLAQTEKCMNGNQWYICETIRCINQNIGRIIRNREDYGSIYLLDERFKKNDIFSQISSWARESLKVIDDFSQFKFKVELFQQYFSRKGGKTQPPKQAQHFFTSHLGTKLPNKVEPISRPIKKSISMAKPAEVEAVQPSKQLQRLKQGLQKQAVPGEGEKKEVRKEKVIFESKARKGKIIMEPKECPVCRQEQRLIRNTECIHELCEQCWDLWLKKDLRCPLCRVRVREKYLIRT